MGHGRERGQGDTGSCGVPAAADLPDATDALSVHVVVATPLDGEDRVASLMPAVLADMDAIDRWWRAQDVTRTLRFDLLRTPCEPRSLGLDVTAIRLPRPGAVYAAAAGGYAELQHDLVTRGLGSSDKKYLILHDGPTELSEVCGRSPLGPARSTSISVVYLRSACGDDLGTGGKTAAVAAHELLHGLGALPVAHACAGSRAHACDAKSDVLYPKVEEGLRLDRLALDVGRDDYYGIAGVSDGFDLRESPFLQRTPLLDAPPVAVRSLWASTRGERVQLFWLAPAGGGEESTYRIYRRGTLVAETSRTWARVDGAPGEDVAFVVRAIADDGTLGDRKELRVRVGVGVVDGNGVQVPDRIAPPRVTGLRSSRVRREIRLRWDAVRGLADLAGYRVLRNGVAWGALHLRAIASVPASLSSAAWSVAAVDVAGNVGPPSRPVRIR